MSHTKTLLWPRLCSVVWKNKLLHFSVIAQRSQYICSSASDLQFLWCFKHKCMCTLDLNCLQVKGKKNHLTLSAASPAFSLCVFHRVVGSPHWLAVLHLIPFHHSYKFFHISRGRLIKLHCLMRSFLSVASGWFVYQISACGRLASVSLWLGSSECQLVRKKNPTMCLRIFNIYKNKQMHCKRKKEK